MKETVLIFGGSAYVESFSRILDDNDYRVIVLTRKHWFHRLRIESRDIEYRYWDLENDGLEEVLKEGNYIVNLAEEEVLKRRWTKKRKTREMQSRTKVADAILQSLKTKEHKIKCVISASSAHCYDDSAASCKEDDKLGSSDFLGVMCQNWEANISPVQSLGIRLVIFRMALIISPRFGILRTLRRFLEWGIAPVLGRGDQILSWIHIQDYARLVLLALSNKEMAGIYNAAAPFSVSQKYFISVAQRIYYSNTFKLYMPRWVMKLLIGESANALVKSVRVSSEKVEKTHFEFKFKNIEKALRNVLLEL